ncbi:MAG: hypothetical protein V8Q27_04510, partial [Eubacteriales bacterium]
SRRRQIMIPIYDVYYALIDNHIIDITHFGADDATELEKSVSQRFQTKREQAVAAIMAQLNSDSATAYQNLSREMKNYMSYIVANVLMGDNQVLMKSEVDTWTPPISRGPMTKPSASGSICSMPFPRTGSM